MSKLQTKRLMLIFSILISISIGISILLYTLKQNINLFYTPSEIINDIELKHSDYGLKYNIRLGGIVVPNSISMDKFDKLSHEFQVTDNKKNIKILYTGILPDLFKEGKAIVAEGKMQNTKVFIAHTLLAKHDENYKPPKLANI
tara:strand:- start:3470 stop:3901 length:432 start_codon:yes stop_codon:yes gene_type:complete